MNRSFQTYIAEKTAEATNIDPEETLYQNLVSIAVPDDQLLHVKSTKWKKLSHKPHKPTVGYNRCLAIIIG